MVKLREVESGYGDSLGRVQEFEDEHAQAILDHQVRTKIVAWEIAPESTKLTEGDSTPGDSVSTDEKKG